MLISWMKACALIDGDFRSVGFTGKEQTQWISSEVFPRLERPAAPYMLPKGPVGAWV